MKKLKNLKIRYKLIAGFLIIALITVGVGLVGIANISALKSSEKVLSDNTHELQYTGTAAIDFQQLQNYAFQLSSQNMISSTEASGTSSNADTTNMPPSAITTSDPDEIQSEISTLRTTINENLNNFKNVLNANESDNINVYETIDHLWAEYQSSLDQTISYVKAGDQDSAQKITFNDLSNLSNELQSNFIKLNQQVVGYSDTHINENKLVAQVSVIILVSVVVIAIIISIVMGLIISRSIGYPIQKITEVTELLADGNINIDNIISQKDYKLLNRKDEIGSLTKGLNRLIENTKLQVKTLRSVADGDLVTEVTVRSEQDILGKALSELVEKLNKLIVSIASSADSVANESGLVADSGMALSQGATEQASAVQQLTASLEYISSQTNSNAKNAETANKLATNVRLKAENGNTKMKDMLLAMDEICITATNIGKIIKVIDDIAFQTNILALNAAVESPRAGQYGKGFAVVAEEVRSLASKSANAVKETTSLVEGSLNKVKTGADIAESMATDLNQMLAEVKQTADLINTISQASDTQAVGIEQINQGVLQVSQVVQTNAATAEESAAASEELSGQASQLRELIGAFRTKSWDEVF